MTDTEQSTEPSSVALIPIRSGILPVGTLETVAEADGRCWLVGSGCDEAYQQLQGHLDEVSLVELDAYEPANWSSGLAPLLPADAHIIVPFSPDGRDLAPHLAAAMGRALVAGATEVTHEGAVVARRGGLTMQQLALGGPVVATFQLGVRSVPDPDPDRRPLISRPAIDTSATSAPGTSAPATSGSSAAGVRATVAAGADQDRPGARHDLVELIEELPADPATMDLAEAPRIVAGGAGLGEPEHFAVLDDISKALGASVGATRVVTDWGWLLTDRQIGTTGVTVDPDLYLAVGISGAVQHTAGLGNPSHVIVVNTDPCCPMMDLADLGIICDGPAFLQALGDRLAALSQTSSTP